MLYCSVKPGAACFTFIPLTSLASGIILLECVIRNSSNQFLVLLSVFEWSIFEPKRREIGEKGENRVKNRFPQSI